MSLPEPEARNQYHSTHAALLLRSYHALTGHHLLPPHDDPAVMARRLYEAPIFVASHNTAADPILTYGNLTALSLFEMTWNEFTRTPSRLTAEEPNREERAHLLARVTADGFIDDYSGIRISKSGQRFRIHQATVWNLLDETGQAATFAHWEQAGGR